MLRIATVVFSLLVVVAGNAAEVTKVKVIKGQTGDSNEVLSLSGTVESAQNASLAPLESGVIASVLVEAGDKVEQGQTLLVLDDKLAKIALLQAKADFQGATASFTEAERLLKEAEDLSTKKVIAKSTIDERRSQVAISRAQVARAKAVVMQSQEELDRHQLKAPFSGVISKRHVDIGEWVTQQTIVYTLIAQDKLRVSIAIPQEYLYQLSLGSNLAVTVTPDVTNAPSLTATLSKIVKAASNNSRALAAWIDLPEQSHLVSGMSASVELSFPSDEADLVWLPKSALKVHPDGGNSVFIAENNIAKNVPVQIAKTAGSNVAVSGIDNTQNVIISGVAVLKSGTPVSISGE